MSSLTDALFYATIAGATIPIGGLLACVERIQPAWLEAEFRHSVTAFGGGVLVAAIALVLVPQGVRLVTPAAALLSFALGGVLFLLVDRWLQQRGNSEAQFLAMLLDFLPESLALGAMLAWDQPVGLLLALLIATQNLPEGFNAYRELARPGGPPSRTVLWGFTVIVLLGPIMAWIGYVHLRDMPALLGSIMLGSAGGILYLMFQDIAPQVKLERHWAPPLGAVAGFMLGLAGSLVLH